MLLVLRWGEYVAVDGGMPAVMRVFASSGHEDLEVMSLAVFYDREVGERESLAIRRSVFHYASSEAGNQRHLLKLGEELVTPAPAPAGDHIVPIVIQVTPPATTSS